jgi:LacI family transcriptional regulator
MHNVKRMTMNRDKKTEGAVPSKRVPVQRQTTLKDIAQRVGVSTNHVSLALRGSPLVSAATSEKIQKVAAELDYRPNRLIRAIQSGLTGVVGVVIRPADAWMSRMVSGIHDVLCRQDTLPLLDWMPSYPEAPPKKGDRTELEVIHNLLERRVDGIIVFPYSEQVSDLYFNEVWERDIPLVLIDRRAPHTHADFVGTDETLGGTLAAEHLLELGHRQIGHIAGFHDYGTYLERRLAFEQTVAAAGGNCISVEVEQYGDSSDAARELLSRSDRPTAVFLAADSFAQPLYREASARGLRIPEDLSVIGYADLEVCTQITPALTTIRQHPYQMGCDAARLILDRIGRKNKDTAAQQIRLKPELVVRASTAPDGR